MPYTASRRIFLAAFAAILSLFLCGTMRFAAAQTPAKTAPQGEIVVAIRYFLPQGVSHAHLFLYREDGKLLRQLTKDNTGQDTRPMFAPDGKTIVWTREVGTKREIWQITPLGKNSKKLQTVPAWYAASAAQKAEERFGSASPYFTNADSETYRTYDRPADGVAPPRFQSPDGNVELILRSSELSEREINEQDDGQWNGRNYGLRDVKTGRETKFDKLPGFHGTSGILHDSTTGKQFFLYDGKLRVTFWDLHLNSTDGTTIYALDLSDLKKAHFVRLSPNWAAPFPLPGQAAFLTSTEVRYVPIAGSPKTANSSYVERWDSSLHKVRYARPNDRRSVLRRVHVPARLPTRRYHALRHFEAL